MKRLISLLTAAAMLAAVPFSASAAGVSQENAPAAVVSVQTPDTPDRPEDFGTPDEPSDTPDTPDAPPATPDTPAPPVRTPDEPEPLPEPTDTPDEPERTDTPDEPETADEPPESPDTPDTPDTPQTPDEPETPDKPEPEPEPKPEPKPEPPEDTTEQGDVTGDGLVTSEDALLVLRYSVGFYGDIRGDRRRYADMNSDNVIDSYDAMTILRLSITITQGEIKRQSGSTAQKTRDDSAFSVGIDVSAWQGKIDFNKVKAAGIDFVIIRAGYGREVSQKDVWFERNYAAAKAAGLQVGAYWYSYATSADDARREAWACLNCIAGKKFEYPIFFDLEEGWQLAKGTSFCSSLVSAFCSELEKAHYYAGFYTSTSFANNCLSYDVRTRYAYWAAEWGGSVHYAQPYGIWQYSGNGRVNGVNGAVDLDCAYIDYPSVIKEFGLNGYE